MQTAAWLVLAFPLAGCVVIGLGFRALPARLVGWLGTAAIAAAFVCAVIVFLRAAGPRRGRAPGRLRRLGLREHRRRRRPGLDPRRPAERLHDARGHRRLDAHPPLLGRLHVASDRGYARFFAYLNFFVFSMLAARDGGQLPAADRRLGVRRRRVVPADLVLVPAHDGDRARASRRSSSTSSATSASCSARSSSSATRGTLDFLAHVRRGQAGLRRPPGRAHRRARSCSSSAPSRSRAQVPLHTWLPDAMEGPTPVSALIHAATMVTAGVYLIARMHPLFELSPARGRRRRDRRLRDAADRRRRSALAVTDLKRVIAYSTMSQIGYMIMAVSAGAYVAGLFHLMTHAFFKALLFMAAGSIIAAMAGEQSLDRMGGFRRAMPFTLACFVIGGLALAGVPPFSGFFSKDEILLDHRRARRLALGPLRRRLRRRVPDRDLHVADDLPRLLGRARARRRASSRTATSTTPRRRRTRPPARSRTPTSASPAPSTTSPSAPAR